MTEEEIRRTAFAMPLHSPAYPRPPFRYRRREYLIFGYETDPEALAAMVPAPLKPAGNLVNYEFIRMPDSTGFGDYTESGQVIPVIGLDGEQGSYTHAMYLDDEGPIAGGREIWGYPKKLAHPMLRVDGNDTMLGTLDYGTQRVATGSMGYKFAEMDAEEARRTLADIPNYLLKIVPHVDGTARICELVRFKLRDVTIHGAWTGPGALELHPHALAPVADLPVRRLVSAKHIIADLTLDIGAVAHDYLAG